ncbi:M56 family metallopeptidase [Arcticibacter eurypsychrophilus]|uniref:M56 family metallopeptidase n=1 Tax=Arcticibacter eurypsychrophilus TaxID=1434752 RepID=UPI00084D2D4F|nr:M56 family metallopeptidase [Arcticibacter eurypsychrophilus]
MRTLSYLLEVSVCTGIFFLFYQLFLSKVTFFTLNRWFLLLSLLTSFLIPAITISARLSAVIPIKTSSIIRTNPIASIRTGDIILFKEPTHSALLWQEWLPILYFIISGLFCLKLIISIFLLLLKIKRLKVEMIVEGVKILKASKSLNSGSFFSYIFLNNKELNDTEIHQVIAHELAHTRRFHSIDIIITQVVQAVLWFNPFIYLYIKRINENHEYEVDQIITLKENKSDYAALILYLSSNNNPSLYNEFSMVPIKRRISILFKNPTCKMKKLTYLFALPLVVISCFVFAKKSNKTVPNHTAKTVISKLKTENAVLMENSLSTANKKGHDSYLKRNGKIKPALTVIFLHSDSIIEAESTSAKIMDKISYSASDSIKFSKDNMLIYLFGNAHLQFVDTNKAVCKLAAAYITINRKSQNITGIGSTYDSILKEYTGLAQLAVGNEIGKAGTIKLNLSPILKQVLLD